MRDLQIERELMAGAESKIRAALSDRSPGETTSALVRAYASLCSEAQRTAFVSVLASRLAVNAYRASA